ncbi:MAG: tetratricopeptide repeat protein [Planctomycetaceae bacterium]
MDFDKLWNYAKPQESEARFREALESLTGPRRLELLTQIARAQGLQRRFEEAHATLDRVERDLPGAGAAARIRCLLERGRVFNSSQEIERARPLFLKAYEQAVAAGEEFHAVDAAHMVAIVERGAGALEWNLKALAAAEAATDERARGWRGSLYNNIGWTWHDAKDYGKALEMFEKALAWRRTKGPPREVRTARWCVARVHRSLGRLEEALRTQLELRDEIEAAGEPADGFVLEEIAECLLALGRPDEARPNFRRAHDLLAQDAWFVAQEPARLERLRTQAAS